MIADATSLDRFHDIVQPPPAPWWPLAPGWYVVSFLIACGLAWLSVRCWRHWRGNAYRRAALRELSTAGSSAAIAELLRRTALCISSRERVASLTGASWASWLAEASPSEMTGRVRAELAGGVYRDSGDTADIEALRDYASDWIRHHRVSPKLDRS